MNPFQQDNCPLCHAKLEITHNVSSYAGSVIIYECPRPNTHYTLSVNADTGHPILSRIKIPLFQLMYCPDETVVYLLDKPPSTSYHYVCVIPGYFPLDWDNIDHSSQRLKNLLIFS